MDSYKSLPPPPSLPSTTKARSVYQKTLAQISHQRGGIVPWDGYEISIYVNIEHVNDTAKELIPEMIRRFSTDLQTKFALVSSPRAVQVSVTHNGEPFNTTPREITTDDNDSEERQAE